MVHEASYNIHLVFDNKTKSRTIRYSLYGNECIVDFGVRDKYTQKMWRKYCISLYFE